MDFFRFDDYESVLELRIDGSVGKASSTDPNTLQDTIASKLMHDKSRVYGRWNMRQLKNVTSTNIFLPRRPGVL